MESWSGVEWSGVEFEFGVESPLKENNTQFCMGLVMKRKCYCIHFCILNINKLVQ